MALSSLPTELLHIIISYYSDATDELVNLTYLNRRFHSITNPVLYRFAAQRKNPKALANAVRRGFVHIVQLCLDLGANPDERIWQPPGSTMPAKYPELFGGASPRSDLLSDASSTVEQVVKERAWSNDISDTEEPECRRDSGLRHRNHPFHAVEQVKPETQVTFWSPLHIAAARGDSQITQMLLDHGATPRVPGSGVCPCHNVFISGIGVRGVGAAQTENRDTDSDSDSNDDDVVLRIKAWSPLHVAVCSKQYDCAKLLIERDGGSHMKRLGFSSVTDSIQDTDVYEFDEPDPDLEGDDLVLDPVTFYHIAAMYDEDTVRLNRVLNLLKHPKLLGEDGLGVDVLDHFGNTAFAVAAYAGHLRQLGPWFLERAANIDASVTVNDGQATASIFLFLCSFGLFSEATLLMVRSPTSPKELLSERVRTRKYCYIKATDIRAYQDMGAVVTGDWPCAQDGMEDYLTDANDRNALHLCCCLANSPPERPIESPWRLDRDANTLLQKLLLRGLKTEHRDADFRTPLLLAVQTKSSSILRTLLSAGADVNAKSSEGRSAWHVLFGTDIDSATLACARLLVNAGLDINTCDYSGYSPLRRLFARTYARDILHTGTSNMDRAIQERRACRDRLLGFLAINGADFRYACTKTQTSLLVWASGREGLSAVESLLDLGAPLTAEDYIIILKQLDSVDCLSQRTWKFTGPVSKEIDNVRYLFKLLDTEPVFNGDLHGPAARGIIGAIWSEALLKYVKAGWYQLMGVLLEHGVSIPKPDDAGNNVVHLAAAHWQGARDGEESPEISRAVKRLIAGGAESLIDLLNKDGHTPLQTAIEERNVAMVYALVQNGADIHGGKGALVSPATTAILTSYRDERMIDLLEPMLDPSRWERPHKHQYLHCLVMTLTNEKTKAHIINKMLGRRHWKGYNVGSSKLDDVSVGATRCTATHVTLKIAMGLISCGITDEANRDGDTALSRLLQFLLDQAAKAHVTEPQHDGFRIPDGREDAILALFRVLLAISTPHSLFSAKNRLGQTVYDQIRGLLICPLSDQVDRQTMVIAALRTFVKAPLGDNPDMEDPWILKWAWKSHMQGQPMPCPDLLVFNDMRAHHELVPRELLNDMSKWRPFWRTSSPLAAVQQKLVATSTCTTPARESWAARWHAG